VPFSSGFFNEKYQLIFAIVLHSASSNALRNVRIITNPPVSLNEPFRFHREDGKYSLVEQVTMQALSGRNPEEWKIAGVREGVVPERVRIQERMKREEEERLAALKAESSQQISAAA